MALSRSEIEVLLRMRSEGLEALDLLGGRLGHVGKAGTEAGRGLEEARRGTKGVEVASVAAGAALGLLVDRIARGLVGAFRSTIDEANKLDAGLIGLTSVAKAFGQDVDAAKDAALRLAADGLMSVAEASQGLKNLMAAGFGLDQAIVLMQRFKDSAAFGRQAALTFGQAVVSATEGIKNGNSILVDNAGVTKNLSIMLEEAGLSAQDLMRASSDVNVRLAIFNGILRETTPQLGDAARLTETTQGAMAAFGTSASMAQAAIGKQLQPALGAALNTLRPLLDVVQRHPEAFVRLASAVAAVVVPLGAFKLASATGVTQLAALGMGAVRAGASILGSVRSVSDASAAIRQLGESAGLTVAHLGKLGAVGAVAAAGFVGWQIGRLIGDLTGLTAAVERWASASGRARLAQETQAAQQDVLTRAIRLGASESISYAQAVEFLAQKERERLAAVQTGQAGELARLQIQRQAIMQALEQGRLTRVQADDELVLIAAAERRLHAETNRKNLTDALAAAERTVQAEIRRTGLTTEELTARLGANEEVFKRWAESQGLSAQTVKFLEDRLKKQKEAQDQAKEAAKKHREEIERQREALQQVGLVTLPQFNARMKELETLLARATAEGIPLDQALVALRPRFQELYEQAKLSGVGIDEARAAMDRADAAARRLLSGMAAALAALPTGPLNEVLARLPEINVQQQLAEAQTRRLTEAYHDLGLKTPEELRRLADAAIANYRLIAESGTATPAQIREAHERMVEAVNAATGRMPSAWETVVVPGIRRQVETLQTAISGSFAQMLLGAKSFGEGFVDIWKSIKAAVLNVFNEIVGAFVKNVLGRILGALSGGKAGITGGFGNLLSGLFGGGAPATAAAGAAIPMVAGLPSGMLPGVAIPGLGGAATGGGFSLGALLTGGPGLFGLGTLATGGLLAGIVGAVFGLKKLFGGPSRQELAGRADVKEFEDFLASTLTAQQQLEAGGERWKATVIAVRDAYLATGRSEQEALNIVERLWAASKKGPEEVPRVIAEITGVLEQAKQKTQETTGAIEDMGAAGTAAGDRQATAIERAQAALAAAQREYEALRDSGTASAEEIAAAQRRLEEAQRQVMDAMRQAAEEAMGRIREQGGITGGALGGDFERAAGRAREAIAGAASEIERALRDIEVPELRIPVSYDVEGSLPRAEIPGAQHGVFATRPTLRVFAEREPELGGPIEFMTKALAGALERVGGVGSGGGPEAPIALTFQITTINPDGLRAAIEKDVVPALVDVIRLNRGRARTDLRNVLGVR